MMRPRRLMSASELMDQAEDAHVLRRTLRDLAAVNRWLGGTRAVLGAIGPWLRPGAHTSILDVGCGGGDIARAIERRAANAGASVTITAVDANPIIAAIARRNIAPSNVVRVLCADAFNLPFEDRAFDVTTLSLTLHHFNENDATRVIAELARVTAGALIVNELERSWLNYAGARLLAETIWRNSPHTRHDGPVSVLRAFTSEELTLALANERLEPAQVRRQFFYRLVGIAKSKAAPAVSGTVRA